MWYITVYIAYILAGLARRYDKDTAGVGCLSAYRWVCSDH